MSVREYIGARYVPIFATPMEWDSTRTYEPLTIVLHQGNSYTSRQAVPVGIDISNETFWAQTGNYNAQIEGYRQEVRTFDNRITQNANDIVSLETDVGNLKTDLGTEVTAREALEDRVDIIESDSWVTENRIANNAVTENKLHSNAVSSIKIVDGAVTTDKILNAAVTRDKLDPDVLQSIATSLPINWFNGVVSLGFGDSNMWGQQHTTTNIYQRICTKLGCTYNNYGVSSSGWQTRSGYASVLEQINAENDVNADDVKVVFIMSGINDYHYVDINASNFANAIDAALDRAVQKYRNAIIVTMFDSGMQLPRADMLLYEYTLMDMTIRHKHCVYVSLADICCNSLYWNNQNHYNDSGAELVASRVCTTLMGGSFCALPGKYQSYAYTASNPTDSGWYGITTYANIMIDPFTLKRTDVFGFDIGTTFANVDSSVTQTSNGGVLFTIDGVLPRGNYQAANHAQTLSMWNSSGGNITHNDIPIWVRQAENANMSNNPMLTFATRFNTSLTEFANRVGGYHDMFVTYGR